MTMYISACITRQLPTRGQPIQFFWKDFLKKLPHDWQGRESMPPLPSWEHSQFYPNDIMIRTCNLQMISVNATQQATPPYVFQINISKTVKNFNLLYSWPFIQFIWKGSESVDSNASLPFKRDLWRWNLILIYLQNENGYCLQTTVYYPNVKYII